MKYFSTFSGIGGFELGIKYATLRPLQQNISSRPKEQHNASDELSEWECVGYSEIDKYASQIYAKHFPEHKPYGNIREISTDTLPDFDLLCGGFPCQSFSIAGKRGGFDDTRGTLFFELARIAKVKRPRYLFFENVKGLLSHDGGKTFDTIIRTIDELGYDCQWQVLNSKNFGVPQNRERVFIIGHLRGTPRPKVFPLRQDSQADIVLPTLTARYYGGQANGGYIGNKPKQIIGGSQGNRIYDPSGIATTIASQAGGLGPKTGLYAISPTLRSESHQTLDTYFQRQPLRFLKRNQKNIEGDYAFTVDSSNTSGIKAGSQIRRLTPTECERLQGFPDGWTEGISDSQRYKCLGNAVTVNVIKAIMDNL